VWDYILENGENPDRQCETESVDRLPSKVRWCAESKFTLDMQVFLPSGIIGVARGGHALLTRSNT